MPTFYLLGGMVAFFVALVLIVGKAHKRDMKKRSQPKKLNKAADYFLTRDTKSFS